MVRALLECDSAGNVLMRKLDIAEGKLNAKVPGVQLTPLPGKLWQMDVQFLSDGIKQSLQLQDRTITNTITQDKIITVPADIKWWQKMLMWTGAITLIILTIAIVVAIKQNKLWKRK